MDDPKISPLPYNDPLGDDIHRFNDLLEQDTGRLLHVLNPVESFL